MKKIQKIIKYFLSFPKTVYFNFHYLPFKQAMKLPIWINYNVKLENLGGKVITDSYIPRSILIGVFEGSFNRGKNGWWNVNDDSEVVFSDSVNISSGCAIEAHGKGRIVFGKNFFANYNFLCSSSSSIKFGNDNLLGWNVSVIDGDGHKILKTVKKNNTDIIIGDHVWLCAGVSVLKGTMIASNCVVGMNSVVSKSINETFSLSVGMPAQIIKSNIEWTV